MYKNKNQYEKNSFKEMQYAFSVPRSIFSSTLYNLAYYSMKFKVMKEYEIDVQFEWNNFKVVE